jgi:Domain of unknown function (DUF4279)
MEQNRFNNKIQLELVIITHSKNSEIVTRELGIKPNRSFEKGDRTVSKFSSRTGTRPHGLWAISSKEFIGENIEVGEQMKFFQNLLKDKLDVIDKLKNYYKFDCIFTIAFETEDAGVSFDLNLEQLTFINRIASRFSCSFIARESNIY